jgi:hypothetical protein
MRQAASVALWMALYLTSDGSHTNALKVSTTPPVLTSTPKFCRGRHANRGVFNGTPIAHSRPTVALTRRQGKTSGLSALTHKRRNCCSSNDANRTSKAKILAVDAAVPCLTRPRMRAFVVAC